MEPEGREYLGGKIEIVQERKPEKFGVWTGAYAGTRRGCGEEPRVSSASRPFSPPIC